ncbi:bifunctional riboflavin kinase/FAD synthetase [Desulfolucanica intricata]|uniref:bifunctional riboflavin kinase/FAD synthetase n=1 Tax=Desulfolucanica intricata TaxID=1285191 RepID=UPI00082CF6FF|nr:bifunctional riboflavin kinase/FAD synthetase [Desulfolucanica intricata]
MDVYYSWQGLKERYGRIYLGLGNFDGIHIGHQKLIKDLVSMAKQREGTPAVMTFYPHPMSVLKPESAPQMLLTQEAKQKFMAKLGVRVLLMIPFNTDFARLSPESFIKEILYEQLGVRGIFVGYNYTFGNQGLGTPELLESFSFTCGYEVHVVPPVCVGDQVVSSTIIRRLLLNGEVTAARKFLGYTPFVESEVVYGERRGNTLGFPTANMEINPDLLVPNNGVYTVKVQMDGDIFLGVANIGTKPTFHGYDSARNIEVHLLDFYGDLYGKTIKVLFLRRLRGEKRFNSVGELVAQIQEDINEARAYAIE